jgi:hypothetical protein
MGKSRRLPRKRHITKLALNLLPKAPVKVRDLGSLPDPVSKWLKHME